MKKHILMAAVAACLMLAGCGGGADDEAVTVTVTGSANVRDAATAEGTSVLETLSAGTELTGRWVQSDTKPSEQWFEYERDGEKAYVWARNLSAQSDSLVAAAQRAPTAMQKSSPELERPDEILPVRTPAVKALKENIDSDVAQDDLMRLTYSELRVRARLADRECCQKYCDGSYITEQARSCSISVVIPYKQACYAKDRQAKSDCSNAGNVNECIKSRHFESWINISVSGCMAI